MSKVPKYHFYNQDMERIGSNKVISAIDINPCYTCSSKYFGEVRQYYVFVDWQDKKITDQFIDRILMESFTSDVILNYNNIFCVYDRAYGLKYM